MFFKRKKRSLTACQRAQRLIVFPEKRSDEPQDSPRGFQETSSALSCVLTRQMYVKTSFPQNYFKEISDNSTLHFIFFQFTAEHRSGTGRANTKNLGHVCADIAKDCNLRFLRLCARLAKRYISLLRFG